jgi:hypothetical protein
MFLGWKGIPTVNVYQQFGAHSSQSNQRKYTANRGYVTVKYIDFMKACHPLKYAVR